MANRIAHRSMAAGSVRRREGPNYLIVRDLTLIEALYTEIDNYLEQERHHAAAHADTAGIARIEKAAG